MDDVAPERLPNESEHQLPPSDLDWPAQLPLPASRVIDYHWLQAQIPRWEAMLAEIKRLAAEPS